MNQCPRKCLNFKTDFEAFREEILKCRTLYCNLFLKRKRNNKL